MGKKSLTLSALCATLLWVGAVYADPPMPPSIDWRAEGKVTPVKDQGDTCDSSWAFSATGVLEGWNAITTGKLESLSEQELLDCVRLPFVDGCNAKQAGAVLLYAGLIYATQNGLNAEDEYQYTGVIGKCDPGTSVIPKPAGIFGIPLGSEELLAKQVEQQPVAVTLDGSWYPSYQQGIFSGPCGRQPNASALIVGLGEENGVPYWLVKNSLGTSWGEAGFFRIVRGRDECGIADWAIVPELAPPPSPWPGL